MDWPRLHDPQAGRSTTGDRGRRELQRGAPQTTPGWDAAEHRAGNQGLMLEMQREPDSSRARHLQTDARPTGRFPSDV